jgi:L-ascorbate metabolism protein UlaG (beta-lactamase superfamily)
MDIRIYHSGDCIPFDGQTELLRSLDIDLALLPINGRDEIRSNKGIPGNFTIDEAIRLCLDADIGHLLCHHFEMFEFNTIDRETVRQTLKQNDQSLKWLLPELETTYTIRPKYNEHWS